MRVGMTTHGYHQVCPLQHVSSQAGGFLAGYINTGFLHYAAGSRVLAVCLDAGRLDGQPVVTVLPAKYPGPAFRHL